MNEQDLIRLLRAAPSPRDPAANCPPAADLAAFLARSLAPTERERVLAHLGGCSGCAAEVTRMYRAQQASPGRSQSLERRLRTAVAAAREGRGTDSAQPRAGMRSAAQGHFGGRGAASSPLGRLQGMFRRRGPAAGLVAAIAVVAAIAMSVSRPGVPGAGDYRRLLNGTNELIGLARRGEQWPAPAILLGLPAVARSSTPVRGTYLPDGAAFLPEDPLLFFADAAGQRGPWRLTYTPPRGTTQRRDGLEEPLCQVSPPPGGWSPGTGTWKLRATAGSVSGGRFVVLGPNARRMLAEAEQQFQGDPARMVPVYYRFGLTTRALQALPRIGDSKVREQYRKAIPYELPEGRQRLYAP